MAYDTKPWSTKDIVYTGIIGFLMILVIIEWTLWIVAFIYSLIKAYQKADRTSAKVLAVLVALTFTVLRFIFLPIMVFTLPLPSQVTQYFPDGLVAILQRFAFYGFALLFMSLWSLCIFQLVTQQIGRKKRMKKILDEITAPKVVIVMPCYNEDPETLHTAVDSVIDCDYPAGCLHVFLSFDGDQIDDIYIQTITSLGWPEEENAPYPTSLDVVYKGARVTVSRFPHSGKRGCQKNTYELIGQIYLDYLRKHDDLFVLFIDSDCILDKVCIQNFMYDMEFSPGNNKEMLAMTGIITSTTKQPGLITLLQDMEYVHGQVFERTVESACGSVTCLPGALTMLRFSALQKVAKYYFADRDESEIQDIFDYGRTHLGEDRWLTHLFMLETKKRYQIQMCTSAFCKTAAVQTYKSLIKQRRRWFLGFITNEACFFTDWHIWRKYPLLVAVRFMQNTIRTTGLLIFIMILAMATTSNSLENLPIILIALSLGMNWAMMIYCGIRLRRFKAWMYPVMFLLNPIFSWWYMVYGIFTAGQRTWGGPRTDAGAAAVIEERVETIDVEAAKGATGEHSKPQHEISIIPV